MCWGEHDTGTIGSFLVLLVAVGEDVRRADVLGWIPRIGSVDYAVVLMGPRERVCSTRRFRRWWG